MNDTVQVEGDTLEDALTKAAATLGVEREGVDFKYDREHLAAGASTVRIYAKKRSEEELAKIRAENEARAKSHAHHGHGHEHHGHHEHGDRAHGHDRGHAGDRGGDRGRGGFGGRGGRPGERSAGPRAGGRDDRGRGGRDRRGGPDRGDRGGDRGGDRRGPPRRNPEHDKERDDRLRDAARVVAQRVLAGEGTMTLEDLNSYERHLVHTIVAEVGGLVSRSIGDSLRKTVEISKAPANAEAPAPAAAE